MVSFKFQSIMKKYLLLILISFQLFSQKISEKGKLLIEKSFSENSKNNYDNAFQLLEQAIKQCIIDKDTTNLFLAYNNIYSLLINQNRQKDFLNYLPELKKYENTENFEIVSIYNNLGSAYQSNTDFETASYYYSKAINKINSYKTLTDIGFYSLGVNNNLAASIFGMQGDHENALIKSQNSLYNYLKIKDKFPEDLNEIGKQYSIIGEQYMIKKQYNKALEYFKKAPSYIQNNDFSAQITLNKNLAVLFLPKALNQPDSSKFYLFKALSLQKKFKLEHLMGSSYEILGNLQFQQNDFRKAQASYQKSLDIRLPQKIIKTISQSFKNLGITLNAQQYYPAALQNLTKALYYNSTNFKADNIAENPKIESIKYKNDAIEIFKEKVIALLAIYKKEGKKEYLDFALATANRVNELINYQRNSFQLEGSKLFLSEQAHAVYGLAIEAAYQKYLITKDLKYINLAFQYSEANKSVVLFESIKANNNASFRGVPQALIDQENKATKNMAIFENQLYKDAKNEDQWRKKLIDATDELAKLKAKYKKDYSQYYNFKYNTETISIVEVQSKLAANQSVIEYFLNENTLYTFLITKTTAQIFSQNIGTSLKENIENFKSQIINKSIDKTYQKLSFDIYKMLFNKALIAELGKRKIENLKIIGDGVINFIPLESLLIKPIKSLKEPNIYLLERFAIGYLPSATMNWKNVQTKEKTWWQKAYIGFAPTYKKGFDLPENQANVKALAAEFSGEAYLSDKATIANFNQISSKKSNILHLSMHGGASAADAMESYLAFEKDSLFVHDIYTKSIPTDLAILDACETGMGILNNGEGVLNLARAFLHAGSQAVAMSLWKLTSSPETSEIIHDFAGLVEDGKPKDEALRQAKLNFLQKHRKDLLLSHPFYWSPLILVGNAEPIAPNYSIWWIIGIILSIVAIYLVYNYLINKSVYLSKK